MVGDAESPVARTAELLPPPPQASMSASSMAPPPLDPTADPITSGEESSIDILRHSQDYRFLDIARLADLPLPQHESRPLVVETFSQPNILYEQGEAFLFSEAGYAQLWSVGDGAARTKPMREWELPNRTTFTFTNQRIIYMNGNLAKPDSVAVGTGVVFGAMAVVSNARAKKRGEERTAGLLASGHIRLKWLEEISKRKYPIGGFEMNAVFQGFNGSHHELLLPKLSPEQLDLLAVTVARTRLADEVEGSQGQANVSWRQVDKRTQVALFPDPSPL